MKYSNLYFTSGEHVLSLVKHILPQNWPNCLYLTAGACLAALEKKCIFTHTKPDIWFYDRQHYITSPLCVNILCMINLTRICF